MTEWTWPNPPNKLNMWNWASRYLELGWNVIPIEAAGKRPRIPWEEYQVKRVTPELVEEWWNRWPYANIGLICGKISGVIVLDIDRPDLITFGEREIITPKSKTSRGFHLFFRYQEGIGGFRGQGFDLQSTGKYVILPPSEHSSGASYEWLMDPWSEAFLELPQWLLTEAKKHVGESSDNLIPLTNLDGYFQGVREPGRHNAAVKLVGYLLKQKREEEEIWHTLRGWNLTNIPPLPIKELQIIFNTLKKKHEQKNTP
jgi:hypothetical protein